MTALAPLESRHPRPGQSLWWLWVMRPRCLHAHATPAGVLVCPAGRPGEVSLPSVASSPHAGGGTDSRRREPLGYAPPPRPLTTRLLGAGVRPPSPRPGVLWLALRTPRRRSGVGARPAAGGHIAGTCGCPWCPRAQQYRTPLCAIAHALHGGVPMCFANPRLTPSFVCLRPALPCARVLWCETYGVWLLARIGWPRVHHLEGEVPPAIWRCGLRIEISAIVHRRALGPSFCRASLPVRRFPRVALWLGALRLVASGFLLRLSGPPFLRPSLLPIRPEPMQMA